MATTKKSADVETHQKSTELVIADETAALVASEFDDLYAEAAGAGFENVTRDDIQLPRLVILQPTSPEIQEDPDAYRAGDIIDNITKENFGSNFLYYPLFHFKNNTRWEAPEPGSAIDCRSMDAIQGDKKDAAHGGGNCLTCPFSKFIDNADGTRTAPSCTQFNNMVMFAASGEGGPIVYSAKRTALKGFKAMLNQAMNIRVKLLDGRSVPLALYFGLWRLTTVKNTANKQTWYTPKFEFQGKVEDVQLMHMLKDMHTDLKEKQSKFTIDQSDVDVYADPPAEEVIAEDQIPY